MFPQKLLSVPYRRVCLKLFSRPISTSFINNSMMNFDVPLRMAKGFKGKGKSDEPAESVAEVSAPKDFTEVLEGITKRLSEELNKLRGGTVNPKTFDSVVVEIHGEEVKLPETAQISARGMEIIIHPFDADNLSAISKALVDLDMGYNPIQEESYLRVPIPKTTKEIRQASMKQCTTIAEIARSRVRQVRQKMLDQLKKEGLPEDDHRRRTTEIQKKIDGVTTKIDAAVKKRSAELEKM